MSTKGAVPLITDPKVLLRELIASEHGTRFRKALAPLDLSERQHNDAVARLLFAAADFKAYRRKASSFRAMGDRLEGVIAAAKISVALVQELYLDKASAADEEHRQVATLVFGTVVEALLPGLQHHWDEREHGDGGNRHKFPEAVRRLEGLAAQLRLDQRHSPARSRDAAFDRLVGTCAALWLELTGEQPTAASKGDPSWRSPFARFLVTIWPAAAGDDPPPSNNTIKGALRQVVNFTPRSGVEIGDCPAEPLSPSSRTKSAAA